MSEKSNSKKSKNIFSSHFTFTILSKLSQAYRPSQIATQLGVTPQAIYYHTDRMVEADLIHKDISNGIKWTLTDKGKFILKQKATGSVNSFNNYQTRLIPTRLDNLSFEFMIASPIPSDPILKWNEMKNGVSKCSFKYDSHTVELIKSGKGSVMLIHLNKKYCFDWCKELIKQYNLAIHYAKQSAIKFSVQISDDGYPIKRPHIAYEHDLIASYLAASYTSQIETRKGNDDYAAWIDSSNGSGEFETDDPDYVYLYLMMPKTVDDIANKSEKILSHMSGGYERCYHPFLTINN
jgi:DNA-binding MarR family transcriptional regulator